MAGCIFRVKRQVLALALVVVPVSFLDSGCQAPPSPAAKIDTARGDWEADIAKIRSTATFYVRQVRERLPSSDPSRATLERKYADAETAVNLWIQDVQDSIRAGRKPDASGVYARRELAANEAYSKFVVSAEAALDLENKPKFLPLAALAPGLVDMFWKKIMEAQEKRSQEAQRLRNEYAARLDAYKLPAFTKVD